MSEHTGTDLVLIIGAGAAGLATAAALKASGVPARVLEKEQRVGGTWRRRHPQLRLNTHRALSGLPGLAIPRAAGAFPGRDAVADYLEAYARHHHLRIEYGVETRRIDPEQSGWQVETSTGTQTGRHVVIAMGRDRIPFIPSWPGADGFTGRIIHAADLGDIGQYRGRRILVVGAGNSGVDVMNHLARIKTEAVWASVRQGSVIFPTRLLGVPAQRLSPLMARLPLPLVDAMLVATERLAFGNLARYGLGQGRGGVIRMSRDGTAVAVDDGFVATLKAGRITIVPPVERFSGRCVVLWGGAVLEPDVVICATGYRTGLEPVVGHLGVLAQNGTPAVSSAEVRPALPGLWFMGMWPRLTGYFHDAASRSVRIANCIAADLGNRRFPQAPHSAERRLRPGASAA